jgi:2-oxoglutarate ferredoxin oxidoreductase subunit beta
MADASPDDLWIHDETDQVKAGILARFFDRPNTGGLPRPFGVYYVEERFNYEDAMISQITEAIEKKGNGDLNKLLSGGNTWTI